MRRSASYRGAGATTSRAVTVLSKPRPMPCVWPTECARPSVQSGDGPVEAKAYALCLADRMRAALRRRDLFASPSLRYADPRRELLDGGAWEAARPTVCRTLGMAATASEELTRLAGRLNARYRATIANRFCQLSCQPTKYGGSF